MDDKALARIFIAPGRVFPYINVYTGEASYWVYVGSFTSPGLYKEIAKQDSPEEFEIFSRGRVRRFDKSAPLPHSIIR